MSKYIGHYPSFDVMNEKDSWDPHTQQIVLKRLDTKTDKLQFFNQGEAKTLYSLCTILLDDERREIIEFVVHHFDSTLKANFGESQRKANVPSQTTLICEGFKLLNKSCVDIHESPFNSLGKKLQQDIVDGLMKGAFPLQSEKKSFSPIDFIHKIWLDATAAYYSHPTVWSEIGYAGPAYPRGYVRSELGLTDPWEARKDAK